MCVCVCVCVCVCWGGGGSNSGNRPYLVTNTYGLNFIKIGGISIFRGSRSPLLGGITCDL